MSAVRKSSAKLSEARLVARDKKAAEKKEKIIQVRSGELSPEIKKMISSGPNGEEWQALITIGGMILKWMECSIRNKEDLAQHAMAELTITQNQVTLADQNKAIYQMIHESMWNDQQILDRLTSIEERIKQLGDMWR